MCNPEKAKKPLANKASDDDDHRPLVQDLLEEHASAIESVKQKIRGDEKIGRQLYDPERYDDIWILRFVLSQKGNAKHASKVALKTMKFREEWKLNEKTDYKYRIKNCGCEFTAADERCESLPGFEQYNKYCGKEAIVFYQPDPDRGLLSYIDMGVLDCDGMVEGIREEEFMECVVAINEAQYQILDEVTRRTGRLTKLTRFVDLENYSFLKMNRKYLKRDGAIQKKLEDFFPQMVDKQFIFNVPGWLSALWAVVTAFFPKRSVEKLDVCPSSASTKFHAPTAKHVSEEHQFVRYGGKNANWPPPSIAELQADKMASSQ